MMKIFKFLTLMMLIPSLAFGGASRDFDGADDKLDIGDKLVDGLSSMTAVTWVYPETVKTNATPTGHNDDEDGVFGKVGISADNFGMSNSSGGSAYFIHNGTDFLTLTGTSISADTWTNFAGWWDNSDEKIYLNAAEDATQEASGGSLRNNTNTLKIGRHHVGQGNDEFDGQIAHVMLFNTALSEAEITEVMWKPGSIDSGLIGYWPIFGTSSPEEDLSKNSNTATVSGATASSNGPPVSFGGLLPL